MINVFIADDHQMFRDGLKNLIEKDRELNFIGDAEDGIKAYDLIIKNKPDVAVIDITMPGLNGIELTKQIKKTNLKIEILILSMHSDAFFVTNAFNAGAKGYILKEDSFSLLIEAIKKVYYGNFFLSPSIDSSLINRIISDESYDVDNKNLLLTERERQILQMIAEGCTNNQIAEKLLISVRTVDTHRKNIMAKLNIHNVAGLVKYAIRHKIITI